MSEKNSGEVYSIQHYVINFVSDLRQVGGFLLVLLLPSNIQNEWEIPSFVNQIHQQKIIQYTCIGVLAAESDVNPTISLK
jgi:hypothetical protein